VWRNWLNWFKNNLEVAHSKSKGGKNFLDSLVEIHMSFDGSTILAFFIVGSIGFVLVSYGFKMKRVPHMVAGVMLLVYPYFIDSVLAIYLIAPIILGLMWLMIRRGV
jgi:hypothetical protein